MGKILKDRYIWGIVAILLVFISYTYFQDSGKVSWLPSDETMPITDTVIDQVMFLSIVVLGAYRFHVRGGIIASLPPFLVIVWCHINRLTEIDDWVHLLFVAAVGIAVSFLVGSYADDKKKLKVLATHDDLTGLYNSREFLRLLQVEIERFQRYKSPLSLLMIDVDHFKNINDRYGHQSGDNVLREIATLMQRGARSIDYVARYGGEEFTILLPDIPFSEAMNVAERLRNTIANHATTLKKGQTVNVTVSIGVASFPEDATSSEELVAAADRAMYAAKVAGRNKVCCQSGC